MDALAAPLHFGDASSMQGRRSRSFWAKLSAEVDRGATVAAVAGRHRVNAKTLSWWRWRLRREGSLDEGNSAPDFLPVVLAEPASTRSGMVELLVSDVVVRVDVGTDVEYLASVVGRLRRGC